MAAPYDLKEEKDVKEFIANLGIEYRYGCYNENNPEACHLLADYLEAVKKDFQKAAGLYKNNCDDNAFAASCLKTGRYAFLGKGGQPANQAKALSYFEKGCELGSPESCMNAGLMHLGTGAKQKEVTLSTNKDFPKALGYLNKACDKKNADACYFLSGIYITGSHGDVSKDMNLAHKYSLTACQLGNAYACANLSMMYRKGDGVPKDEALANKYKQIALDIQEQHTKTSPTVDFQQGVKK